MREFPEVQEIVAEAAKNHPTNINAATDQAESRIRGLDCFEEIVSQLVRSAVKSMVWGERHRINVQIGRENGIYATRSKVDPGSSPELRQLAASALDLHIAGRTLGKIRGDELLPLADGEDSQSEAHRVKARLLRLLRPLVSDGQLVEERVSAKKADKLLQQAQREVMTPGD